MSDGNQTTLSINLSKIKETPIPNGLYHVTIVKAQIGLTADNDPKVDVRLKIAEGSEEGRIVFDTMVISEDPSSWPMRKLKQLLLACGIPDAEGDQDINLDQLTGEVVTANLKMGQASNKINPQTGKPWEPRVGVTEYSSYGGAVSAQDLIEGIGEEDE